MNYKKLWIGLAAVIIFSFAILGYYGADIYREAPPVPDKVVTTDGKVLFTGQDIKDGQNVWQSIGGQELGTVWGHGSYIAPDWTADWVHREVIFTLNHWSQQQFGTTYEKLSSENKALLEQKLKNTIRKNTYDKNSGTLTISNERSEAFENLSAHYAALFGNDPKMNALR